MFDPTLLSRIQFGFTIGFHIIFPTINMGLALFLAIMEWNWFHTKQEHYLQTCRFWAKIFALTFGMGVVSGIVMEYELGTNFSRFTNAIGGVLGPLFSYEVLTAFFLEAGFLGIMLFGWQRVSAKMHFFATLMVALGTTFSAFWIMSANSWMHSPSGYQFINGVYQVSNWYNVIFNPLFIPRMLHMLLASYVATGLIIMGAAAWILIKTPTHELAKLWLRFALVSVLVVAPTQVILGDILGLKIHELQPLKTAAMEGLWQTTKGAPFIIFAIPNNTTETNSLEIAIPKIASFLNTHDWNGELTGLTSVAKQDRPNVPVIFFTFRIMVALGFLFTLISLIGYYLLRKNILYQNKTFLKICVMLAPSGLSATLAGWLTSEIGRQPWTVYGLMRTADSVSPITGEQVAFSLSLFLLVYGLVFSFYLYFVIKLIAKAKDPNTLLLTKPVSKDQALFTYMAN